jgi:hypothetical protein
VVGISFHFRLRANSIVLHYTLKVGTYVFITSLLNISEYFILQTLWHGEQTKYDLVKITKWSNELKTISTPLLNYKSSIFRFPRGKLTSGIFPEGNFDFLKEN